MITERYDTTTKRDKTPRDTKRCETTTERHKGLFTSVSWEWVGLLNSSANTVNTQTRSLAGRYCRSSEREVGTTFYPPTLHIKPIPCLLSSLLCLEVVTAWHNNENQISPGDCAFPSTQPVNALLCLQLYEGSQLVWKDLSPTLSVNDLPPLLHHPSGNF